jgi:lysyl-tRNA synthetase, class II
VTDQPDPTPDATDVARRGQGKLAFGALREDGVDVQLFVQLQAIGEDGMAFFADTLDVGDWVGVDRRGDDDRRGELSIRPSR